MCEFGGEDIHRQAGLEASNRSDMAGCAVVIFDKPSKGSFDSFVGFALGEECVLRGGAGEVHCFVSFYVLKVADCGGNARFIFDFFSFPRSDHRGLRQAPDQ